MTKPADKPWIGIPTRYHAESKVIGQIRHYLDAVIDAGGIPLMIPTVESASVVDDYLEQADGILLPGSPTDVDPKFYGAEPHPKLGKLYPERDSTDFALLKYAETAKLPILGICFGIQSLNVFRGGSLVQDIPSVVTSALTHDESTHAIRLEAGSLLAGLATREGALEMDVNSFHHQSIERPGRNLRIAAKAPDGVIEAVEDVTGRFVVGVQWHPERGWQDSEFSRRLFSAFVQASRKSKSQAH
ncbi:MAG TPA: gamma-glutamyl-gamma-aminobutyrate hydrolase family protein [Terriglobia bacterium]|nr:gamma-glutamyl-gamma-aminobutyrate hydrolase family protein [Terriglobia bacterium]